MYLVLADEGVLEMLHIKLFRKLNKSTKFSYLSNVQSDRLFKSVLKVSFVFCIFLNNAVTLKILFFNL